ncbi:Hsp20/alpha crystallin family protein [Streptomyces enissocaesilis]|uniref:SHSP domain-containing protein n=1 Tax=Streptomyces enissocaesilis TaxID=332589 RepID=A0ABP6K812_9ACTN
MLMRTGPLRGLGRLPQQLLGAAVRPAAMPMGAGRHEGALLVHLDLPGIDPEPIGLNDPIGLNAEQDVLTVKAGRSAPEDPEGKDADMLVAERPHSTFSRQPLLVQTLGVDHIEATYDAGVLRSAQRGSP